MHYKNSLISDLFVFMFGVYGERFFVWLHTIITQMNPKCFAFIMLVIVILLLIVAKKKQMRLEETQ